MKRIYLLVFALGLGSLLPSCKSGDNPGSVKNSAKLIINFEHFADGAPLVFDSMNYVNVAGNKYEITEIQWFISDITLNNADGSKLVLDGETFAHYIDTKLPETQKWVIPDSIPAGDYSSLSMTFGIKGEKNKPFMFTDPPESNMLWPANLGGDQGGYHYMKINGFWMNNDDQREPFNFHLGVGQERDAENKVTGFIQNWIEMELPVTLIMGENETKSITVRMNVEKWWDQPNVYDHNVIGGKIMQNQKAMRMAVENGKNVFTIGQISSVHVD